jgi:hypothetical protein
MKIIKILIAKFIKKYIYNKEDWYIERTEICQACPFLSDNVENKKGLRFLALRLGNFNNPFCTDCGCEIKAKAAEKMEECPQGKWKQVTN